MSVREEVIERLALFMGEYDCGSWAKAIETVATMTLKRDEGELAQILANQ